MSSPILHIQDSYYFELPKVFYPRHFESRQDLIDSGFGWAVRGSKQYQQWEIDRVHGLLADRGVEVLPSAEVLEQKYEHWQHAADHEGDSLVDFLRAQEWFTEQFPDGSPEAQSLEETLADEITLAAYNQEADPWSESLMQAYSQELSGKVVIPQPFGTLKNLYESQSGFCISKFMILELVIAVLLAVVFIRLAGRMQSGERPRGRGWNLLEAMLLFFRDEVARPAIGHDADRFVPLLWTIFFFVLGCNLVGMVPWAGAPTGALAVTVALAACTLVTGVLTGSLKFGPVGFWTNQVPSMDLPVYMAIFLKPIIWIIEVAGMFIRHGVLAVRLLANMIAGHLVLFAILALAFSLEGAASGYWWVTAPASVIGSALFSLLELFVAFLQAYIFTFLSALFIGAANHHH